MNKHYKYIIEEYFSSGELARMLNFYGDDNEVNNFVMTELRAYCISYIDVYLGKGIEESPLYFHFTRNGLSLRLVGKEYETD